MSGVEVRGEQGEPFGAGGDIEPSAVTAEQARFVVVEVDEVDFHSAGADRADHDEPASVGQTSQCRCGRDAADGVVHDVGSPATGETFDLLANPRRVGDSRTYSWRVAVVILPTRSRKSIAVNHSSPVSFTSRVNSCRCADQAGEHLPGPRVRAAVEGLSHRVGVIEVSVRSSSPDQWGVRRPGRHPLARRRGWRRGAVTERSAAERLAPVRGEPAGQGPARTARSRSD